MTDFAHLLGLNLEARKIKEKGKTLPEPYGFVDINFKKEFYNTYLIPRLAVSSTNWTEGLYKAFNLISQLETRDDLESITDLTKTYSQNQYPQLEKIRQELMKKTKNETSTPFADEVD